MARCEITDDQWDCIKDLLPEPAPTGRPPRDRRIIVNAILWILRTGSPWRDLPDEFGPWPTAYRRFDQWNDDGTLDTILSTLRGAYADTGEVDLDLWCIDGSIVRAHRCAGGGGKKGIRRNQLITH